MSTLLGAMFFGAAGLVGILLSEMFAPATALEGGPKGFKPPVIWILAGCAIIGAIATAHAVSSFQIVLLAIVCVSLSAIWCTDARFGIVPDALTLGPLAIILLIAFTQHQWGLFISAAIPFAPFAVAATLSKGLGMGWGDVKLAALGGAVLGAQTATLAFALACAAAVIVAYARGFRGTPIAFAPYLVSAIFVAIPIGSLL